MIKETYLKEPPDSIYKQTKDNVFELKGNILASCAQAVALKTLSCRVGWVDHSHLDHPLL